MREAILDAAERSFAERGLAGVSMRGIAAEAGLRNQASLYHHFQDKQALYEAVLERGLAPLVALLAQAGDRGLAPGPENPALDRLVDYLAEHPQLSRLIQRANLDDSRLLRTTLQRILQPLYVRGLAVLSGAAGPWEPADLPHLAAGLFHLIFGYFANAPLLEVVADHDPHSPAAVARQRRFLKAAIAQLLGSAPARRVPRNGRRRF